VTKLESDKLPARIKVLCCVSSYQIKAIKWSRDRWRHVTPKGSWPQNA